MKFDHYEYTIADHWASAIINADYTGLDDEEAAQLTQWMNDNEQRGSHWDIEDYDGGFARDEISGLYANCVKAIQYFPMRG